MSLANLIRKGGLRGLATATVATPATDKLHIPPSVATVATVAVAKAPDKAANDPAPDPDRWAWPHSNAMSTSEIDAFTARLARFTDRGLTLADAEAIADKLVMRDRESENRHLCVECAHLRGRPTGWHCGNWPRAEIALRSADAQLPGALVLMLQRCNGFTGVKL